MPRESSMIDRQTASTNDGKPSYSSIVIIIYAPVSMFVLSET